jgi:uncharacterized damage-inducible protein DinB
MRLQWRGEVANMLIREPFLSEFDREMANTRKTLERVPDDKWDWKPHPKSGTMGWLAAHVGNMTLWAKMTFDVNDLDVAAPSDYKGPKNRSELLAAFDKQLAEARTRLAAAEDSTMMENWTLRAGPQVIFTMPRAAVLRGFVMNHMIHHRAQLTVYLRLNDLPVPALYGPSGDEGGF